MFLHALNLAKIPVLIAMIVTPIRFSLELAGLPENVTVSYTHLTLPTKA